MKVLSIVFEDNARAGIFAEADADFVEWKVPDGEPPPPLDGFDAVMVFGGSMHPDQVDRYPWLRTVKDLIGSAIESDMPMLGVCLGSQLIADVTGAPPYRSPEPEIGWQEVEITPEGAVDPLLGPLAPSARVFAWHYYEAGVPPGGVLLARSRRCVHAFRLRDRPVWAVQFHAEVTERDLNEWLDDMKNDPEAVGADAEAIRAESRERLPAQQELGRGLATRFLEQARSVRAAAA